MARRRYRTVVGRTARCSDARDARCFGASTHALNAEAPLTRVALTFLAGVAGISTAAIFVRLALPAPPVVTGFYRMLFATLAVGAWVVARGHGRALVGRPAMLAALSGLCFGTDLALWHTSIVRTSVATATLLVNTTPIYVGLFSFAFFGERLGGRFSIGAGAALLGTVLLVGVGGDLAEDGAGGGLALLAALFYAGYLLLMAAARRDVPTVPALFLAGASATAVLGVYGVLGGDAFSGFPASSWTAMVGAAIISQIIGVMGIVWSLRYLPTTLASVALLAQPVGTAILGWLILDEAIGVIQGIGGAMVLIGIALASRSVSGGPVSDERG